MVMQPGAKRQVITVTPTGGLETLRRKSGDGVDLRQFGPVDIRRVSEVEWDVRVQGFMVQFRDSMGSYALTCERWYRVSAELPTGAFTCKRCDDPGTDLYFREYEDAVAAEVYYLDALRLSGSTS